MTYRFGGAARRRLAALIPVALILTFAAPAALAQRAGPLPATVDATYRINFTALGDIGHFHFISNINGETYNLSADARVNTAIFEYDAGMGSRGTLAAGKTKPAGHNFSYRQKTLLKKKKKGALTMAFDGAAVTNVSFVPPYSPSTKAIPVTQDQLKSVLDPLSGVMTLSLVKASDPCVQKLPIYDGKQRFDIVFAPLRRAGADHVCAVRMVPISGHKPGEGGASVIKGTIELVLRPVPKGNVVIPYKITVPTTVGTATLTTERIDITMPDQQRIALRR
jgi:hypothetical protein